MAEITQLEEPSLFVNLQHPWRFDGNCTIYLLDGTRKNAEKGISWESDRVTLLGESGNPNGIFRENYRVKEIRTARGRLLWVNHGVRP